RARLHLRRLGAETVTVVPPDSQPAAPDSTPFQLPESLTLPLGVRIDRLRVAHFVLGGDEALRIDGIAGDDLTAWKRFRLGRLALSVAGTHLDGALHVRLGAPYPLVGTLHWQRPGAPEETPAMQGTLDLNGTVERLDVTHKLSAPMQVTSTGTLGYRDGEVHLRLTHRWSSQPLPVATPVPVQLADGEL